GAVTVCIRQGYVLPAARPRRRVGHVTSPQGPGVPGEPSSPHRTSTALLTDKYELTMIHAALADGTADRPCVFEAFARRLPSGRRSGVVGATRRLLRRLSEFRFSDDDVEVLAHSLDRRTVDWLRDFRYTGDIHGYPEGELFVPGSQVLTVRGGFAECGVLESLRSEERRVGQEWSSE